MNIKELSENVCREKIKIENPGMNTDGIAIDPATIMLIIKMVTKLVDCMKSRNENVNSAQNVIQNPNFFDTIRTKAIVFRTVGFKKYRREGKAIMQSLRQTGNSLTLNNISDLLEGDQG